MAVTSDDPDAVSSESESENEYSDTDPAEEPGPSSRMLHGSTEPKPIVPRKSSKRKSREPRPLPQRLYDPPITRGSTSRLPFEEDSNTRGESHSRTTSSASRGSSSVLEPPALIRTSEEGRPASGESIGRVSQGRVGAVVRDERGDITGSQAELVRGGSGSTKASSRRSKAAK